MEQIHCKYLFWGCPPFSYGQPSSEAMDLHAGSSGRWVGGVELELIAIATGGRTLPSEPWKPCVQIMDVNTWLTWWLNIIYMIYIYIYNMYNCIWYICLYAYNFHRISIENSKFPHWSWTRPGWPLGEIWYDMIRYDRIWQDMIQMQWYDDI